MDAADKIIEQKQISVFLILDSFSCDFDKISESEIYATKAEKCNLADILN
jgi:hypothetical protein